MKKKWLKITGSISIVLAIVFSVMYIWTKNICENFGCLQLFIWVWLLGILIGVWVIVGVILLIIKIFKK